MEPKYKVTYFNGRGLCECIRLILAHAGQEYIDDRIDVEQWAQMKSYMFMRLPALKFDDVVLTESRAICRFLAREHGLAGDDNVEAARCDMLVDEFYDIYTQLSKWRRDDVTAKLKTVLINEFITGPYIEFIRRFNTILRTQHKKGQPHYFVGNKMTWADIVLANGFDELMKLMEPHLRIRKDFYVNPDRNLIVEFVQQILHTPSIKAWIDKRPKTPF